MARRRLAPLTLLPALAVAVAATAAPSTAFAGSETIVPGAAWNDTDGHLIQAHGGGILQVGKTYYWFGEDHADSVPYKNVPCYASTDLVHWKFRGNALSGKDGTISDLGPHRVLERPKVLYNAPTKTYVMYMHIDSSNYGEAKVGVATCSTVDGTYTYRGSFRPMGHQSRDMSLFMDKDGAGYLLFEDRASGVRIERLSDDYLHPVSETTLITKSYEGLAVVHLGDLYYLLGSHLSGWDANANQYATAPSLAGPWSEWREVAPPATRTYDSQTAFILTIDGTKQTTYMYGGDRWNRGRDLANARYIWMPLEIGKGTMKLPPDNPWTLDAVTGRTQEIPWKPPLPFGEYHVANRAVPTETKTYRLALASYGNYTLTDPASGNVLDVSGQSVKPGDSVTLYMPNGGANQAWSLTPTSDGYYFLTSKNSGLRLALRNGALVQERPTDDPAQQWKVSR